MEPINLISHRATLKKVASTPGTTNSPPQVAVTLVYPMTHQTLAALGGLLAYVSHEVDTSLLARHFPGVADPDDLPMDQELARVQRDYGQPERMRPGPEEACLDCSKVIGDDPEAGFHVPIQGPPSPLCGDCVHKRQAEEDAAELPADTDPASQSWCPTCSIWLAVPTGGLCEVCGTGTTSEPEKAAWQRIADGEEEDADGHTGEHAGSPGDVELSDEPIGDGPMPRRPDGDTPALTTPTRRKGH